MIAYELPADIVSHLKGDIKACSDDQGVIESTAVDRLIKRMRYNRKMSKALKDWSKQSRPLLMSGPLLEVAD